MIFLNPVNHAIFLIMHIVSHPSFHIGNGQMLQVVREHVTAIPFTRSQYNMLILEITLGMEHTITWSIRQK